MVVLSISNIRKQFGVEELFSNVTFSVNETDRMAIVGANGTGKSTLLKIIIQKEDISPNLADGTKGGVYFGKNATYGYLSQDVIESLDHTLREEALLAFQDLIEMEKRLAILAEEYALNPEDEKKGEQYGRLLSEFEHRGGYDYNYRVTMMLSKFGFSDDAINRPIRTFSGGERMKMAFVKLLLLEPNVLILDEPTNHLDVSTIDWLENYLKTYHGAILFVSHDRYFINNIANKVLELENKTVTLYQGNFDEYVRQKKERYEIMLREYNLQQKEIEKLKRFIAFYKPKPRFVSRAKDREKKLEHMKKIDRPKDGAKAIHFNFDGQVRSDKKIIYFDQCVVGFNESFITPFSFYLFGNDKLAIMGDNGTGKTTLLRSILQEIPLFSGSVQRLMSLNIGYIKQNDFDFVSDESLLNYFTNEFPNMGETAVRTHLGKFAFTSDDVFKSINVLSGGEKMRVILAQIVLKNYDVLLLDEPTNHLDLLTREALISAMQSFEGCLIFVSHDRYFIDSIANKILYFSNKKSYYHEGNYETFKEIINELDTPKEEIKTFNKTKEKTPSKVNQKDKLEKKLKQIEEKIEFLKQEEWKEENYNDYKKMKDLENQIKELEIEYEDLLLQCYD